MTTALDGHIEVDDAGVARVAGTRLKVIHLVLDRMAHNSTPDEMVRQFPPLTLAQVHAALLYYYDHKDELDWQIESNAREVATMKEQSPPSPSRAELTERLARKAGNERQP